MPSLFQWLCATAVVTLSIHVKVASSSPALPHEKTLARRAPPAEQGLNLELLAQMSTWITTHTFSQNTANGNPSVQLPPIDMVFKMMAPNADSKIPPSPKHSSPAPQIAAAAPGPAYVAPGIVVPSSAVVMVGPEGLPPDSSTTPPSVTPTTAGPEIEKHDAPVRKLVVIGAVIAGLVVMMFCVYVFFNQHILAICGRRKEDLEEWTKINSPPPPRSSFGDMEKEVDVLYAPPWTRSSASSYSSEGSDNGVSAETKARSFDARPPSEPVLDICSSNTYPRSKFSSVCSSQYPTSVSSVRTSGSEASPDPQRSPLLPAYEFFCAPSSVDLEDYRHSRTHSAPIFGHDLLQGAPGVMVRSVAHRRSRSVSGLTYEVRQNEQRESGLSAGDWRGSPPQANGWPSTF